MFSSWLKGNKNKCPERTYCFPKPKEKILQKNKNQFILNKKPAPKVWF
jgi:hypothetical protein